MMPILSAILTATMTFADAPATPPSAGSKVADFSLKDIHRRPRSIADYKQAKAFVVVFLDTECPLAKLYLTTLKDLHKKYTPAGVQFIAINSGEQDSFVAVSAHAQEREIHFPVLKDFDHKVADAFGAKRTCEVFLLDTDRVIRYHGRIDDQYGIGFRREKPNRNDLQEAIDEFLAGKPVAKPKTEVAGCPIERRKPLANGEVTYAKQVSRIMQKRCQECHRPGEIGPFSLLTYDDAKKRSARLREVLVEERMPPWHADPRFGKFVNDRRLPREEIDTLLGWIDSGTPKGDDADMPKPIEFVKGWKIGKPEQIFTMEKEFAVPESGVIDYQRFIVDPKFKEDVWVQAAECRPGNREVMHHILVYIIAPGKREPYSQDGTAATLAGWAPGDMPARYPPGTARRIPAGSKLMFEVHYTPNGVAQKDRSSVGIILAKEKPDREVEMNILANMLLRIPPMKPNVKGEFTYTFRDDALILSFMPHMHLRGTSAKYIATYPDGKTETLLSVPDYDFGWQSGYRFQEPLRVPKGTKLQWIGHWDNSPDNPRNPDSKKEVHWGLQTWDEMQNGWMEVVWLKK